MADDAATFDAARAEAYSTPLETIDVSLEDRFANNTIWPFFERLRHEDPVHYTAESAHGPYWSVTKYNDIMTVDTNHQVFSSEGVDLDLRPAGRRVPDADVHRHGPAQARQSAQGDRADRVV